MNERVAIVGALLGAVLAVYGIALGTGVNGAATKLAFTAIGAIGGAALAPELRELFKRKKGGSDAG